MSLLDCFKCVKSQKYYAVSSKAGYCVDDLRDVPAFIEEYAVTMTDCHKLPYPVATTTLAPMTSTEATSTEAISTMATSTEAISTDATTTEWNSTTTAVPHVETGGFGYGEVLGIMLFVVVLIWVLREIYRLYKKRTLGSLRLLRRRNVNYDAAGETIAMDTAV